MSHAAHSTRFLVLLAALAALVAGPGCGRKVFPQPPPQIIPARTTDLAVQQRGGELLLRFTYPQTTAAGLPLGNLQAVEFWEMVRAVPSFAAVDPADTETDAEADASGEEADTDSGAGAAEADTEPAATAVDEDAETTEETTALELPPLESKRPEDLVVVELPEFEAAARIRLTLTGPELDAAISGDRVVVRFPLAEPAESDERQAHLFAVKTISNEGLGSAFSNTVVIVRRETPPPPAEFTVEPTANGIELAWEKLPKEAGVRSYSIYRRDAQIRDYGDPVRRVAADEESTLDSSAVFGARYIYSVVAVIENVPLVETALSTEREIEYVDTFAPPAPRNLALLPERDFVRLIWEASTADDIAGYFIERQEDGGPWVELNSEPVTAVEYRDAAVVDGRSYRYRVSAIDEKGNRGEAGRPAEVRIQ